MREGPSGLPKGSGVKFRNFEAKMNFIFLFLTAQNFGQIGSDASSDLALPCKCNHWRWSCLPDREIGRSQQGS